MNEELINQYLDYLKYERNLSLNTITSYHNDLKLLASYYDLKKVTPEEATKYFTNLIKVPLKFLGVSLFIRLLCIF